MELTLKKLNNKVHTIHSTPKSQATRIYQKWLTSLP